MRWLLGSLLCLTGCAYGPPEYHGQIENAVLLDDGRVAVGYAQLVGRAPKGFAAFPDGGITKVEHERLLIALVDPDGTTRRIANFGNPAIAGTAHIHLAVYPADPTHLYATTSALLSTETQALSMHTRRMDSDGRILADFDLSEELAAKGRTLGAQGFGGQRVVAADGTMLIGATRGDHREVWRRDPDGSLHEVGTIGEQVDLIGDELVHYVDGVGLAMNWRTGSSRRLSYYDRALGRRVIIDPSDPANRPPEAEVRASATAGPADRTIRITRGGTTIAEFRPDFAVLDRR